MENNLLRLKEINDQNALKAADDAKHHDLVDATLQTQQIILRSFSSLVDYLSQSITKTEVINQLENIGTPDVAHVVSALNGLHETLQTHENTDLSEITSVMREVLTEAQKIPKELPEMPEHTEIDYSKQFESLTDAIKAVEEVVKAQDLKVEAPIVNVPETKVNVEAPNLTPLEKHLKDVTKAVKGIVIPEYKTDNKEVEKQLEKANKTLLKILDRPVGGSGGGGGAVPIQADGGVPTSSVAQAVRIDDTTTATTTYIGKAVISSTSNSAVWQIAKLDTSSGLTKTWADGDSLFNNVWDNRATTITYS